MKTVRFIAIVFFSIMISAVPVSGKKPSRKGKDVKTEAKSVSEYEKLFKDKKFKTAKGFFTIHLSEDGKLIVELPKDMIGRDMLITSAVDQTSNGGDAVVGYMSPKAIPVSFDATDSLVLLRERLPYRYEADDIQSSALQKSHIGAIIATFPIKTLSPDSLAYVFDATQYFSSYDKRLDPVDPYGADSFEGLVSTRLTQKSNLSILLDVQGFKDNISILGYETYSMDQSVFGMKAADDNTNLTVILRRSVLLLPEKVMPSRIADPRLGVISSSAKMFTGGQGSKTVYCADRWRITPEHSMVFYVDTLFDSRMREAITAGVLKWNRAFEQIGRGDLISVMPYPSDDPDFDANDLRYSCIKYEPSQNSRIRSNTWTDPRSGEILCATVYVPFDALRAIHTKMFFEIGAADPSVRGTDNNIPVVYEGLQADVTREIGKCLGLDRNLAASYSIPVDSLRSPSFTSTIGLSGSIMDELPYNYAAVEGDKEIGVKLVHTELGDYDMYAVKWLYCTVPGAVSSADETAYLDSLVTASRNNPYCLYVRKPSNMSDPRYYMDPRCKTDDLGDDNVKSARLRLDNARHVISRMSGWLGGKDPKYQFRMQLNVRFVENSFYVYADLMKNLGGFYLSEIKDGDGIPAYIPVPASVQRDVMKLLLDEIGNMSWLDNTDAYRDIIFVRSFEEYIQSMAIDNLFARLPNIAFAQTKYDAPYSMMDAYDDILDHILDNVRKGKGAAYDNVLLQYFLLGYTLQASNAVNEPASSKGIASDRSDNFVQYASGDRSGFASMSSLAFHIPENYDYQVYTRLLEIRGIYDRAVKSTSDKTLKAQYEYFIMAIDRALKID
ncbi:MAG: zinc-dependent metalloprotease [Bacteroidales bacterium]|nr:zinc-dependent metalloprotease [Bacteroidales bacterium]